MPDAVCLRSQANGAFSQLGWSSSRNRAYLVEGVNLILRTRTNDACRTRSRLRAKPLTATQDTASNAGRPTTVLGPERGMGCAGPLGLGGWPQPAPISNVIAAPIAAARAGDLAVRRRTARSSLVLKYRPGAKRGGWLPLSVCVPTPPVTNRTLNVRPGPCAPAWIYR